eukprot:gene12209-14297_t
MTAIDVDPTRKRGGGEVQLPTIVATQQLSIEQKEFARNLPDTSSPLSDPTKSALYDTMEIQRRFPILGKGKNHLFDFKTVKISPETFFATNRLTYPTLSFYLNRMGLCGHSDMVLAALSYLDKQNIEISVKIYAQIIRGVGITGDVDNALLIFDRLLKVHIFDGLINAHMNCHKVDEAFSILKSMEDKYHLVPDHGLVKNRQITKAIELFSDAKTKGMDPDPVTLTVMIDACAKNDRVEKAFNYYDEFKYLNLPPTEVTFNALINACSKRADNYILTYTNLLRAASTRGEVSVIEKLYKDILERKDLFPHKPDERVFTLVMSGYANNQIEVQKSKYKMKLKVNLERVEQILKDMERLEVPMTKYPLDAYLKAYAYTGKLNTTEKIFLEDYPRHNIKPDVITYNIMISMYCQNKRFEKGYKLLHQMRELGIKPDYNVYKTLMYGTTKVGYASTCLKLAREMVELGFPPETHHMKNILLRYKDYPEITSQLEALSVRSELKEDYNDKHMFYEEK